MQQNCYIRFYVPLSFLRVAIGLEDFLGEVRRSDSFGERSFMSSFMGDNDGDDVGW